jgi:hypothetical protein
MSLDNCPVSMIETGQPFGAHDNSSSIAGRTGAAAPRAWQD